MKDKEHLIVVCGREAREDTLGGGGGRRGSE